MRSFALHAKSTATREAPSERYHPTEDRASAYERMTGMARGMKVFQWDLRYPDATEVTGFEPSGPGGGLEDSPEGPQIVPGSYTVPVSYGGTRVSQPATLTFDSRSTAAQADLPARRDLGLKIHALQDRLDRTVNAAIAARKHVSANSVATKQLDAAIAGVVDVVHAIR